AAPSLTLGPPESPDTVVGPLISAPHRARVESYIQAGADEGGEVVVDGRAPSGIDRGYYVGPTLIAGCHNGMKVVREEIFGPVLAVVPFDTDEEAIGIANDSEFGLYDYVFSEDTARAFAVGEQLEAGQVGVNTAQRNHEAAFGGWKLSGIGRDGGVFGPHAYTEMQSILWPGRRGNSEPRTERGQRHAWTGLRRREGGDPRRPRGARTRPDRGEGAGGRGRALSQRHLGDRRHDPVAIPVRARPRGRRHRARGRRGGHQREAGRPCR